VNGIGRNTRDCHVNVPPTNCSMQRNSTLVTNPSPNRHFDWLVRFAEYSFGFGVCKMKGVFQQGFSKRQLCTQNENFHVKVVPCVPVQGEQLRRTSCLKEFLRSISWILIVLVVFSAGFYLGYAGVWLSSSLQSTSPDSQTDKQDFVTGETFGETSEQDMELESLKPYDTIDEGTLTQLDTYEQANDRLWEQIASKVAIAVKTGKSVWNSRIPTHSKSWWRRIPNKIIISDWSEPSDNIIGLEQMVDKHLLEDLGISELLKNIKEEDAPVFFGEVSDSFRLDSEKNLPGLETLYRTFPNADWYIMIDDDTFIFLDNLARFLLEQSSGISSPQDVPLYFGNPFSVVIPLSEDDASTGTENTSISFAHGGSGIVLSSKAMKTIVPHIPWCMRTWQSSPHGDARVALCLYSFDILLTPKLLYFFHDTPQEMLLRFLPPLKQGTVLEQFPITLHHIVGDIVDRLVSLEYIALEKARLEWGIAPNETIVTFLDLKEEFMDD